MIRIALLAVASAALAGCIPGGSKNPAEVEVSAPLKNAKVSSPLRVEGSAPNNWFFEAVFPLELVVDGKVIAESPANARSDWMTEGSVAFNGELRFHVLKETPAEVVLSEDMPGDGKDPRTVRIPVTLVPQQ